MTSKTTQDHERLLRLEAKLAKATEFARGDVLVRNPLSRKLLAATAQINPDAGVGRAIVKTVTDRQDPHRNAIAEALRVLRRRAR